MSSSMDNIDKINSDLVMELLKKTLTPGQVAQLLHAHLPPPVTCDSCGKNVAVHDAATNMIVGMRIKIGVPGHPGIPPFNCPHGEHWACSVDCWQKVAHDCITNHLVPMLQEIENRLNNGN